MWRGTSTVAEKEAEVVVQIRGDNPTNMANVETGSSSPACGRTRRHEDEKNDSRQGCSPGPETLVAGASLITGVAAAAVLSVLPLLPSPDTDQRPGSRQLCGLWAAEGGGNITMKGFGTKQVSPAFFFGAVPQPPAHPLYHAGEENFSRKAPALQQAPAFPSGSSPQAPACLSNEEGEEGKNIASKGLGSKQVVVPTDLFGTNLQRPMHQPNRAGENFSRKRPKFEQALSFLFGSKAQHAEHPSIVIGGENILRKEPELEQAPAFIFGSSPRPPACPPIQAGEKVSKKGPESEQAPAFLFGTCPEPPVCLSSQAGGETIASKGLESKQVVVPAIIFGTIPQPSVCRASQAAGAKSVSRKRHKSKQGPAFLFRTSPQPPVCPPNQAGRESISSKGFEFKHAPAFSCGTSHQPPEHLPNQAGGEIILNKKLQFKCTPGFLLSTSSQPPETPPNNTGGENILSKGLEFKHLVSASLSGSNTKPPVHPPNQAGENITGNGFESEQMPAFLFDTIPQPSRPNQAGGEDLSNKVFESEQVPAILCDSSPQPPVHQPNQAGEDISSKVFDSEKTPVISCGKSPQLLACQPKQAGGDITNKVFESEQATAVLCGSGSQPSVRQPDQAGEEVSNKVFEFEQAPAALRGSSPQPPINQPNQAVLCVKTVAIWCLPPMGWYKINIKCSSNSLDYGIGFIIRDHLGDMVYAEARTINPKQGKPEAESVRLGLLMAKELGFIKKLLVETDCTWIAHLVNGNAKVKPKMKDIANSIKQLVSWFDECRVQCVKAKANRCASHLAEHARKGNSWTSLLPVNSTFKCLPEPPKLSLQLKMDKKVVTVDGLKQRGPSRF